MPWGVMQEIANIKPVLQVLDRGGLLLAVKVVIGGVPAALQQLQLELEEVHCPDLSSIPPDVVKQVCLYLHFPLHVCICSCRWSQRALNPR